MCITPATNIFLRVLFGAADVAGFMAQQRFSVDCETSSCFLKGLGFK